MSSLLLKSTVAIGLCAVGLVISPVIAQQAIDCNVPPERDVDGNGLDDALVSTSANISSDVLIGCESKVGDNANVLYGSEVVFRSEVEANARFSRSSAWDNVLIKSGAKVNSSGVYRYSTVSDGAYVQSSTLDSEVLVRENATVYDAQVSESDIGEHALVLRGAVVIGSVLDSHVRIYKRAYLGGNNFGFGGIRIRENGRVGEDSQLLGPLDVGKNASIGYRVQIDGS